MLKSDLSCLKEFAVVVFTFKHVHFLSSIQFLKGTAGWIYFNERPVKNVRLYLQTDSNPGQLDRKHERYLCALPYPLLTQDKAILCLQMFSRIFE